MKKINILLLLFVSFSLNVFSQINETSKSKIIKLSDPSKTGKIVLKQVKGNIEVTAYEGKDVEITILGINADDTNFENIVIDEFNNIITIRNKTPQITFNYKIKVPKKTNLNLKTISNGNIKVEGVSGNLELSNGSGNIIGLYISGTTSADTTSGDIFLSFDSIFSDSIMAFSSYSGKISLLFPKNINANINATSKKGIIETGFEVFSNDGTKIQNFTNQLSGKINGGGSKLIVRTHYKNILIKPITL
ncbi:hypothetical protein [Pontimicrobium sp. SW4]|uniref:Adhesin domain-containing protein n=1 Tax=Pontimicrobium sp. SW4 TaxID=3153519 RepID=A0AAU7BRG8_9FLAO